MAINVHHEVPISYATYNVFQRYWWGQGDPLYQALSQRGDSVSIVTLEVDDEEYERLVDVAAEILDTSDDPAELRTAAAFQRAIARRHLPPGRRARANPGLTPAMRRRAKDFRTFHDFDHKQITKNSSIKIPDAIPIVGSCEYVLYRSNKWHDGTHDYIHDITSRPAVKVGVIGAKNGKLTRVPKKIQGIQGVSLIGKCLGLGYSDWDNEQVEMGVRGKCEWWWSQKARALFVIENKKKIIAIVWGGRLNVESRGIVG